VALRGRSLTLPTLDSSRYTLQSTDGPVCWRHGRRASAHGRSVAVGTNLPAKCETAAANVHKMAACRNAAECCMVSRESDHLFSARWDTISQWRCRHCHTITRPPSYSCHSQLRRSPAVIWFSPSSELYSPSSRRYENTRPKIHNRKMTYREENAAYWMKLTLLLSVFYATQKQLLLVNKDDYKSKCNKPHWKQSFWFSERQRYKRRHRNIMSTGGKKSPM